MSNVEFQNEQYEQTSQFRRPRKSAGGITELLIKNGIAKNESTAAVIMMGITILCILIAIIVIIRMNSEPRVEIDPNMDPETGLEYGIPHDY